MSPCIHHANDPLTCRRCSRNRGRPERVVAHVGQSIRMLQHSCVVCEARFLPSHGSQIRCPHCQCRNYGKTKLTQIK